MASIGGHFLLPSAASIPTQMDNSSHVGRSTNFSDSSFEILVMALTSTSIPSGFDAATADSLRTTRFLVQKIIIPVVVMFGVTGNAINIVVLSKRWMKSSTNCYLSALAVFDSLYLLFALTMTFTHYDLFKESLPYKKYHWPYGRPLTDVFSNTGVWLTVTFTVERYIGVQFPIKGRIWCTCERASKCVVAVFFAATLFTLPEFFEKRSVERFDPKRNKTVIEIEDAAEWLQNVGYYNFNQVIFTFLPLTLLMIFNGLLIRTVMMAAKLRYIMTNYSASNNEKSNDQTLQHSRYASASTRTTQPGSTGTVRVKSTNMERQNQGRDQQKITVMLIAVVIVFLVCQLPQAVQKLIEVYLEKKQIERRGKLKNILTITANYFNLLVMINASTNFILYSSLSAKFRRTFIRLFCRCFRGASSCRAKQKRRFSNVNISLKNLQQPTNVTNCTTFTPRRDESKMSVKNTSLVASNAIEGIAKVGVRDQRNFHDVHIDSTLEELQ